MVSMNEPMVRLSKKAVKQEIIAEERAMEENPAVDIIEAFPGHLPPAETVVEDEGFLVKKELVELCEQQRLPVRKKYQLQFREEMCLKTEVTKLRK